MYNNAEQWLQRIQALELGHTVRIMNVCGGHERTITLSGLRSALPGNVELIPGPGCPVCICPEQDIYAAIHIALGEDVILVSFGDMLRVPINDGRKQIRSLEQARSHGADIRAVASPMEAVEIARQHSDKPVVFFAAGFETTMAPVATMLMQGIPDNMQLLLSGRLTWPAVAALLKSDTPGFDCLIAPGHVSAVMGASDWHFVVDDYDIPVAVAGFSDESLLAGFYTVLRQHNEHKSSLVNCYPELVTDAGNQTARQYLAATMDITDAHWRGIGTIPASGFTLNKDYAHHNARLQYTRYCQEADVRTGDMPRGCQCSEVVLGNIRPVECKIYGTACTPRSPVGPCMVSDEGACRIWWAGGARASRKLA